MSDNYEDMTVAELKVILKERDLPVSGKKADLIERLSQSADEEDLEPVEESTEESSVEESSPGLLSGSSATGGKYCLATLLPLGSVRTNALEVLFGLFNVRQNGSLCNFS